MADGTPAVLKIAPPWDDIGQQIRTMMAAHGHGYACVYEYDPDRRAALVESLGPSLEDAGAPVEEQLEILARTLRDAWRVPLATAPPVQAGEDKAVQLIGLLVDLWDSLGQPCSRLLRDTALRYAQRRAEAFDPDRCVVCHGDPHSASALATGVRRAGTESSTSTSFKEYRFVDPDGFRCDPGYDLGVVMRGWPETVLAAEDPVRRTRSWASWLAAATGIVEQVIVEWAFVERVTSGLYLLRHGHHDEDRAYLDSAEALLP